MDNEVEHFRRRKGAIKEKRHPLNVIFDPFYPIIIACLCVALAVWYLEIPTQRFLGSGLKQVIRSWMP